MGFKYWYEGLIVVGLFALTIGIPCFFTAFWGSKMVNDLGNFPSKSAKIQMAASWKILLAEAMAFPFLVALFSFLYFLKNQ